MKRGKSPAYTPDVYCGGNGRWYWRLLAGNNRIVADCAQGNGYRSEREAVTAYNNAIAFALPIAP
jgi:uncharacterized protein YegP (UPF0339 family)